jgi:hypothetical protein
MVDVRSYQDQESCQMVYDSRRARRVFLYSRQLQHNELRCLSRDDAQSHGVDKERERNV